MTVYRIRILSLSLYQTPYIAFNFKETDISSHALRTIYFTKPSKNQISSTLVQPMVNAWQISGMNEMY